MLSGQQNQLASGQHPAGHSVSSGPHPALTAIFTSFSLAETNGQSAAVAAQYIPSGQQYQLGSGQHPPGHSVPPGQSFLAAIFESRTLAATNGQSAAVAAQYMLSGQQYQLASGQQPLGHSVSSGPHPTLTAIFTSFSLAETVGQSSAVAAQYWLSGQQNQLASGQHPAGHSVSSGPHPVLTAIFSSFSLSETNGQSAAVAAQYMSSGQQYQLASGQQPPGHSVSSGPHPALTAIFTSFSLAETAGQSSAVAAQYRLSGQQNQLASGQHPAGHSVSSGPQPCASPQARAKRKRKIFIIEPKVQ